MADLSSFLTQGSAPWTTGTVERPYPNDDYSYTMVAVSTSGESYRIKPGESFPEMPEYNTWHAAQVRASAEGNALYIQGVPLCPTAGFLLQHVAGYDLRVATARRCHERGVGLRRPARRD